MNGNAVSVAFNSCSYTVPGIEAYGGTWRSYSAEIECDKEGDGIEIVMPSVCTAKIPAQSIYGTQLMESNGAGSSATVKATVEGSSISYQKIGSKIGCLWLGNGTGASFGGSMSLGGIYTG